MFNKDSPDLRNDRVLVLAQVARRNQPLRRDAVEMRTVVRDQAVAAAGPGRVAPVGDDRMRLDRREQPTASRPTRNGDSLSSSSMLVGRPLRKRSAEEFRPVAGHEPCHTTPGAGRGDAPAASRGVPARPDRRRLPRWGVAMKTTRRTSDRGLKISTRLRSVPGRRDRPRARQRTDR